MTCLITWIKSSKHQAVGDRGGRSRCSEPETQGRSQGHQGRPHWIQFCTRTWRKWGSQPWRKNLPGDENSKCKGLGAAHTWCVWEKQGGRCDWPTGLWAGSSGVGPQRSSQPLQAGSYFCARGVTKESGGALAQHQCCLVIVWINERTNEGRHACGRDVCEAC